MRPFLAVWTGDRAALVEASNRPGVWLPKEPGDDRWELHAPQGLPEPGEACILGSGVECRFDGGPHGRTTRRVIQLYAPAVEPGTVSCRTEARLLQGEEPIPDPGWSVFDHPDSREADGADFWRLFRVPLPEAAEVPVFAAPRRATEPPGRRERVPDPLARFEAMVDDSGRVNAAFEDRRKARC